MPRPRTGQARLRNGKWYARVTLAPKVRPTFALPTCHDSDAADARAAILADLGRALATGGHLEIAHGLLTDAANAAEGKPLADVQTVVAALTNGKAERDEVPTSGMTYRQLSQLWTSGALARDYPDHVKAKRSASNDAGRSEKHIYRVVGDVPVAAFTLDHAERVMRELPAGLSRASRRHVAQLMHRVLSLAVFPLRRREASPLPRGWLPRPGDAKAKSYIYPDEDARLLACRVTVNEARAAAGLPPRAEGDGAAVPLHDRIVYGFLAREGLRVSEALGLHWRDIDLDRGAVTLDENKTDEPRAWALGADVAEALRRWHALCGKPAADAFVFVDAAGTPIGALAPHRFREHLQAAGVTRSQLFERTASRKQIWVHDLRATFVTLALATGRTESWVADRTGHKSSDMINRYRRAARTATELGLGWLAPLDQAVPELRKGPEKAPEVSAPSQESQKGERLQGFRRVDSNHDWRIQRTASPDAPCAIGSLAAPGRAGSSALEPSAPIAPLPGPFPSAASEPSGATAIPARPPTLGDMLAAADRALLNGDAHEARRWLAAARGAAVGASLDAERPSVAERSPSPLAGASGVLAALRAPRRS